MLVNILLIKEWQFKNGDFSLQIYDLFAEHSLKLLDKTTVQIEVELKMKAEVEERYTLKMERRNNCRFTILKLANTK